MGSRSGRAPRRRIRRTAALAAAVLLALLVPLPAAAVNYPPPPPTGGGGEEPVPPGPVITTVVPGVEIPSTPPPPLGAPAPEPGTLLFYVDGEPAPLEVLAAPTEVDPLIALLNAPLAALVGPGATPGTLDWGECALPGDPDEVPLDRVVVARGEDGTVYLFVSPLPLAEDGSLVVSADDPVVLICAAAFAPRSLAALRLDEARLLDTVTVDADGIVRARLDVGTAATPGRRVVGIAGWRADGTAVYLYVPILVLGAEVEPEAPPAEPGEEPAESPAEVVEEGGLPLATIAGILVLALVLLLVLLARRRSPADAGVGGGPSAPGGGDGSASA